MHQNELITKIESSISALVGASVARPNGTLAGHAAGLPFERLVHQKLSTYLPERTFRHFEYLNHVFLKSPQASSVEERNTLLGPPSLQYLLKRGKIATRSWTPNNLFEEKQNDTAEIVIVPRSPERIGTALGEPVLLIDVKTQDDSRRSQPPNIISAEKVAHACRLALEHERSLPFEIVYTGIKWRASRTELTCTDTRVISLTSIDPMRLYINWAAALQIQFHPFEIERSFDGDGLEWARSYLVSFCSQLRRRIQTETRKLEDFMAVL